jgi:hypothetical protein
MKRVVTHTLEGKPWPTDQISYYVVLHEGMFDVNFWADGNLQVSYDIKQMHKKPPRGMWPTELLTAGPVKGESRQQAYDRCMHNVQVCLVNAMRHESSYMRQFYATSVHVWVDLSKHYMPVKPTNDVKKHDKMFLVLFSYATFFV